MKAPQNLHEARTQLQDHPLYGAVKSPADLCRFTERHVFAVWDFMTLLKSLQRGLTTVSLPWVPARDPETARLVNELVLAEESDAVGGAESRRHLSHFEWYLEAMVEIGADCSAIDAWVERVRSAESFRAALAGAELAPGVRAFLKSTSAILDEPIAVRSAVFHHSRESIIPEMFLPIATHLAKEGLTCHTLLAYLHRHIDLDSHDHALASEQMVARLLKDSPDLVAAAEAVSLRALAARVELWDAILEEVR